MTSSAVLPVVLAVSVTAAVALVLVVLVLKRRCDVLRVQVEHGSREFERLERSFARFAPARLVERIIDEGTVATGERREVTIMFADIRDFTRLSEELDPAVLVEVLNGYFGEMSAVIRSHHGHVTRVMGDGIMSVFGALERNPWHVQDAVEAAIAMRKELVRYNGSLRDRSLPELGFGIGIHCGMAVTGLVGSEELLEFTVMGDAVNVASRVETLTRQLDRDILVTDEVRNRLGGRYLMARMPAMVIKGKTVPIVTWAVDQPASP